MQQWNSLEAGIPDYWSVNPSNDYTNATIMCLVELVNHLIIYRSIENSEIWHSKVQSKRYSNQPTRGRI